MSNGLGFWRFLFLRHLSLFVEQDRDQKTEGVLHHVPDLETIKILSESIAEVAVVEVEAEAEQEDETR